MHISEIEYPLPNLFFKKKLVPISRKRPALKMAISSDNASASSILCVVNTIIRPTFNRSIIFHIRRRDNGSKPVVGSSKKITFGCPIALIPTDKRRFIPPSELHVIENVV